MDNVWRLTVAVRLGSRKISLSGLNLGRIELHLANRVASLWFHLSFRRLGMLVCFTSILLAGWLAGNKRVYFSVLPFSYLLSCSVLILRKTDARIWFCV